MTQKHPLQWPKGRPRTKVRKDSAFKVTPAKAHDELVAELNRFNVSDIAISTNIPLRVNGTLYRDGLDDKLPDPGVTIFFTRKKRAVSVCCDAYLRPWENIRALGLAIKSFRDMERHGATQVLDQAFEGFAALPAPDASFDDAKGSWWHVLGCAFDADAEHVRAAYKAAARKAGGASVELNAAKEAGLAANGETP